MSGIRPNPAAVSSFTLAIVGLLISAYLTFEHFTGAATLACSDTGAVNRVKVTTSPWSVTAGVPVAVAGLAYYAAMTVLCLPVRGAGNLAIPRVVGAAVGAGAVLWLVYVELFKVDAICLWCSAVHVVTVLLLGTVVWWRETDRAARVNP